MNIPKITCKNRINNKIFNGLNNIKYLQHKFKLPIGLSDHSIGDTSALVAASLNSIMLEKHFNLYDNVKTLDSFFSFNEKNLKVMIDKIREIEKILGQYDYRIAKSSKANFRARRSIYVSKKINKGEIFNKSNIRVVRPGFSLDPKYYSKIIGKISKKNLSVGQRLKLNYVNFK